MSIVQVALFLVSIFCNLSTAHPCQCHNVAQIQALTTQFSPVTVQLCAQCPTMTVSAPSQILTLTEITVTSSTFYCPTLGIYICPTGTIIPTSVPCYNSWSASCTIERALPYSDYLVGATGGVITVDSEVYVSGVCVESGSQPWPAPTSGANLVDSMSNTAPRSGPGYPSMAGGYTASPLSSSRASIPASAASSSLRSIASAISSAAPGYIFPTKSSSLLYPNFVLSSSLPNRATWMHDNADKLKDKALKSICLPGSHDSATYGLTREISNLNGQGKYLVRFLNTVKVLLTCPSCLM